MPACRCGLLRPCLELLTYGFNRFDTLLNAAVFAVVASSLIVASTLGSLDLGALFWLPFGLLVAVIQLLAGIVVNTQGFSLVWCAYFGVGLYEEVRWQTFSDSGVLVRGLATLACVLVVLVFALYGIQESVYLPHERPTTRRPCSVICWDRAGTTLLHVLTVLISAVATLVADEWHADRRGGFYAALGGSGLLLLCCTPLALRCRRRAARVLPMTAEQMALVLLQEQLLKTRDRLAQLHRLQLDRQEADQPASGPELANLFRELQVRERALLARIEAKLSSPDTGVRVSTTGSGTVGPPIDVRVLAPITQ